MENVPAKPLKIYLPVLTFPQQTHYPRCQLAYSKRLRLSSSTTEKKTERFHCFLAQFVIRDERNEYLEVTFHTEHLAASSRQNCLEPLGMCHIKYRPYSIAETRSPSNRPGLLSSLLFP
jgi:hypothetical protein